MNRLNYRYFAPLVGILATLFLLSGCLPDKEKAEARRQERLSREVFTIQQELILSGDTAVAITKLEQLNKRHPEHLEIIEALGATYREKGDPLMTAFFYDYAFELEPQNAEFALQAARAHEEGGSTVEALTAYRSYLKLTPNAIGLWRSVALLEMEQGNHQLALSAYLEALRTDGVRPAAQDKLNIAILYHKLGNQPQAQRWYEDLLADRKLEQQLQVDGMIGLFDLALRQKQWERALELMHEIERLSPEILQEGDYASAYTELSNWDKQRKQAEAAARELAAKEAAAKEVAGKEATAQEVAAKETAVKEQAAKEVAEKEPAEPTAAVASTAAKSESTAEETDALKTVVATGADAGIAVTGAATDATTAEANVTTAETDVVTAEQTPATAAEAAEAAAQAASAVELAARGKEAFEAENFTIAAELLERSAKLNPNNGEVLDMLSRASFHAGLFPQAERYAMLATYAEPQNVNYRLEYLRAYQRNHPPASMLQQLISAKETFPQDSNVTLALARGYERIAQRKALAAELYHEYLQMAPDSPLAQDIRQKLLEWEM